MKLTFLGSGSAFVLGKENYHSNILIETDTQNILFDAGTTIPDALDNLGHTINSFDMIYVSHNHADHVGGLEYIGFKKYFGTFPFGSDKPTLMGHYTVLDELWENSLSGGMKYVGEESVSLETYFIPMYIYDGPLMVNNDLMLELIKTSHVTNLRDMPSYGLMIKPRPSTGLNIFITGDTQFNPDDMLQYYESADIIFHDCELADYPNGVHAQYHELKTLPEHIKSKMWLYHYMLNDDYPELPNAVADGFLGFVKRGDSFEY